MNAEVRLFIIVLIIAIGTEHAILLPHYIGLYVLFGFLVIVFLSCI